MRVVGAYSICLLLAIVAVACGITVVLSVLFRSRVNRRLSDVVSFQLLLGVS